MTVAIDNSASVTVSVDEQQFNKCWTPAERSDWINHAVTTTDERGVRRGYMFNTMVKQVDNTIDTEDAPRAFATASLAKALYGQHPLMKRLSLCFYKSMMMKIQQNSFLKLMYNRYNFIIVVKGSNAYKMLLRRVPHEIEHSDLDIIIFINPTLEDVLFEQIRSSLVILVSQVMSRYKKDLDTTLFARDDDVEESILRKDFVQQFKAFYNEQMALYDDGHNGRLVSPFESEIVRNACSKRSFVILNSDAKDDHVVRVEVPHLEKCEFIPLKKSPLVMSYNKTIRFDRDVEGKHIAEFELIRLRLNNMYQVVEHTDTIEDDLTSEGDDVVSTASDGTSIHKRYVRPKMVPADFIDVSIPLKGDADLIDFWTTGGSRRCYEIFDKFVGANIMIPNVNECIRDLSNILNVYTNSHMKTEKRQKRLELFKHLDETRKKWKDETCECNVTSM